MVLSIAIAFNCLKSFLVAYCRGRSLEKVKFRCWNIPEFLKYSNIERASRAGLSNYQEFFQLRAVSLYYENLLIYHCLDYLIHCECYLLYPRHNE